MSKELSESSLVSPWPGICVNTKGLTPTFLDLSSSRAMIGMMKVECHIPKIEIVEYELDGTKRGVIYENSDASGIFRLEISRKDPSTTNKITESTQKPSKLTVQSRMLSFSYTADLEQMYDTSLSKNMSVLTARFYFTEGELATYKLLADPTNPTQLQDAQFVAGGKVIQGYAPVSDGVGVKIELLEGDSGILFAGDDKAAEFFPEYFYQITLDNICGGSISNDFMLMYDRLILLNGAMEKIIPAIPPPSKPIPESSNVFCVPAVFSRTKSF